MSDKTQHIASFASLYDELELVTLRIQDAFDPSWWEKVGGRTSFSDVRVSLANEGAYLT